MAQPQPDVSEDDCLHEYCHLFSPDLLRDKVAFITGGGSGIGFRIAEVFMRHGCHTVIASRSLPRLSAAAKKLAAATGQRCLPVSLDVRDPLTIMAAVDVALTEFGKIDILINGAAGNFLCPAGALSFRAFKTVVDIDTIGTFNVCRVLYEKLFRDHGGVIVNITATLSHRGQMLQVHAGSAKAAVGTRPHARQFPPLRTPGGRHVLRSSAWPRAGCDDTSSGCGMGSPEHPRQQPGPRGHRRHGGLPEADCFPGHREDLRPGDAPAEAGGQDGGGPQRALPGQPPRVLRDRDRAGGGRWGVDDPPQRRPEADGLGHVCEALGQAPSTATEAPALGPAAPSPGTSSPSGARPPLVVEGWRRPPSFAGTPVWP